MATRPKRPRDTNQLAKMIVGISTGEIDDKEPLRAISGRKGGLKGGVTRMNQLTPVQRSALAKKAAAKRWKKTAPTKGAAKD